VGARRDALAAREPLRHFDSQTAPTSSVRAGPVRDDQSSSVLRGDTQVRRPLERNVFTGHPGPREAQDDCNAEMRPACLLFLLSAEASTPGIPLNAMITRRGDP
jgi:hypothetical protein